MGICQGRRNYMQDYYSLLLGVPNASNLNFIGIFDGHASSIAANFASNKLLPSILKHDIHRGLGVANTGVGADIQSLANAVYEGYLDTDKELFSYIKQLSNEQVVAESTVPHPSHHTKHSLIGGTTALCTLITPEHIILANAGDSRGLLITQSYNKLSSSINYSLFTTIDHKPNVLEEQQRIEQSGMKIYQKTKSAVPRIDGLLAVSRGLGDFHYKTISPSLLLSSSSSTFSSQSTTTAVSGCEPDIWILSRNHTEEDILFLVLGTDDIFDVITNEEIAGFILHYYEQSQGQGADLGLCAYSIINAYHRHK